MQVNPRWRIFAEIDQIQRGWDLKEQPERLTLQLMRIKTEFASNFRNIKTLMLDAYRQTLLIPDDLSDQYDKLWNRYLLLRKALATFSELPDEKRAIDFTNVEL
jgi:hypothetical protein